MFNKGCKAGYACAFTHLPQGLCLLKIGMMDLDNSSKQRVHNQGTVHNNIKQNDERIRL